MATERKTERFTRNKLISLGYEEQWIEEQKSDITSIQNLLKNASKKNTGKEGYPEFIISSKDQEFVIVIECKKSIKKHESSNRDIPVDYAVDGVLHYASFLKEGFNVIAIGVSGSREDSIKISNFLWRKNENHYEELEISEILSQEDYYKIIINDTKEIEEEVKDLIKYSRELHEDMRDFAKLTEAEKPILVSAILIALYDNIFRTSYKSSSNCKVLSELIIQSIDRVLTSAQIPNNKVEILKQVYSFIKVNPNIIKTKKKPSEKDLLDFVIEIEKYVKPFTTKYSNIDIVGQFYGEFLRYTGGDGKGLGIVLTPRHITELFADLANLTVDSIVLDPCCGTGAFLISAMHHMILKAENNSDLIDNIKRNNLIGIETLPNMFSMATANMILRGDGKSNLYLGSCFELKEKISKRKPTCGFINPPYSQKAEGAEELNYVYNLLECLEPHSVCIAIVPMRCALSDPLREKILEKHTLEAVMSMPDELFSPVGTIPCIMVFKSKVPHNKKVETWFGYWKDDGFVKTKQNGRCDKFNKWESIKEKWIDMYLNKSVIKGYSVKKGVDATMEWCAEAYMETDYSTLKEKDFEDSLKKYLIFKELSKEDPKPQEGEDTLEAVTDNA